MSAEHSDQMDGSGTFHQGIRPMDVPAGHEANAEQIQQWIVGHLAGALEKPAESIDVTVPFDDFALDSVTAIGMTGELEEYLGKKVDPTLLFDFPTIEQFSHAIADDQPG